MKKFLLLIPLFLFSLMANAEVISITTTSPHSSNNLRQAIAAASTGDIIEMAAGTYVETGDWIAFDDKEVTVRAAAGANVIIKPQFSVRVKAPSAAAKAEFIGVKFDCSALESSQLLVPSDNKANQKVVLKNCELYDWSANKALIQSTSERKLDVIDIDNCYFHGFEKSIVFVENANLVSLSITNSTFANVTGSITDSYYAAPIYVKATSGSVLVDHCTFYDVMPMSLSYGVITVDAISDVLVSNCIFARSTTADMCTSKLPTGSNVKNCLTWYYDNWQPYGHCTTATVTDCMKANPLFKDAANGDYTLRMGSPARGVATDASDLGDPRWAGELAPISSSFSTPLVLEAADASRNEYYTLDANFYLQSANPATVTTEYGIATWKIHANGPANVQTILNMSSGSLYGHTYKVAIYNSNDVKIGEVGESGWSDAKTDIPLAGTIYLSEEGDYTIKLSNICNGSVATIKSITLSYAGGAIQDIPGTLTAADAVFSSQGSRADGMITFSTYKEQWVKWNAATSGSGPQKYTVTLNINNPTAYGHRFTVSFYLNESESPVATLTESSWNETYGTPLAISMGDALLAGGNTYVVKVTNAENGAQPKIISVGLVAAGGATQNIPGSITLSDAILSTRAYIDGGNLHFADDDHAYAVASEWAKWNINATAGVYTFTINVNGPDYGIYNLIIEDANGTEVYAFSKGKSKEGILTTSSVCLDGNYTLKLQNTNNHSKGYLTGLSAAAVSGVIVLDENATSDADIVAANGSAKIPAIKRSFTGGMFNTICVPFNVGESSELTRIFGEGYELVEMKIATIVDDVLYLEFGAPESNIQYGRPYLIKPTKNVTNPVFSAHTINKSTSHLTVTGTAADYIGNFVKQTVSANENTLFLGADNKLYWAPADSEITIKGFRGYFNIKSDSGAPRRARLVLDGGQVATEVELADGALPDAIGRGVSKFIENGQLVIVKDGVYYNAFGFRVK